MMKVMKPQHFFRYLAIVAVLFTACEKDKENKLDDKDYRSQWVGEWDFVVEKYWYIYDESSGCDTLYYLGQIRFGDAANKVSIKYLETAPILWQVDEFGKLYRYCEDPHEYAEGQFEGNNQVHFERGYGAMGGGGGVIVDGIKKEGDKK